MAVRTSFLGLVVAAFLLASLVSANSVVTILPPEADAYVFSATPNANYGSDNTLVALGGSALASSYLTFDVTGAVPAGRVFQSTTLYLWLSGYTNPSVTVNAHEVLSAWTESTITWNNQPGYQAAIVDTEVLPQAFGWYSWDLTSIWPGTGKLRTALETSDPRQVGFNSREFATTERRPYLEVTHTPEPGTLAVLALGLGAALLKRRRRK